mmetsp:Transcript_17673/g.48879  ORF Transcript_17673/g.48879 Transcript_17673/m.48879 type:complete len:113 (-) Transcript_17673:397-735(-)
MLPVKRLEPSRILCFVRYTYVYTSLAHSRALGARKPRNLAKRCPRFLSIKPSRTEYIARETFGPEPNFVLRSVHAHVFATQQNLACEEANDPVVEKKRRKQACFDGGAATCE